MPGPAHVRSTEAIEAFRQALIRFEERASASLDALGVEVKRASDWIQHDRPAYWGEQLRQAEETLHDSKMELERCLMMTVAGERPTCREQKQAVQDWKARIDYCRDKLETTRTWQRKFSHDVLEHHGRIGQIRRMLEVDLPAARETLQKIVRRLDDYKLELPPAAPYIEPVQQVAADPAKPKSPSPSEAEPDETAPQPLTPLEETRLIAEQVAEGVAEQPVAPTGAAPAPAREPQLQDQ